MCTCRPCALLLTKGRRVPDGSGRVRALPTPPTCRSPRQPGTRSGSGGDGVLLHQQHARTDRRLLCEPGGATESLLSLEAWTDLLGRNSDAGLLPDVEALLVHKAESGFECFAIPMTPVPARRFSCRTHWKGFDGGEPGRRLAVASDGLRERSEHDGGCRWLSCPSPALMCSPSATPQHPRCCSGCGSRGLPSSGCEPSRCVARSGSNQHAVVGEQEAERLLSCWRARSTGTSGWSNSTRQHLNGGRQLHRQHEVRRATTAVQLRHGSGDMWPWSCFSSTRSALLVRSCPVFLPISSPHPTDPKTVMHKSPKKGKPRSRPSPSQHDGIPLPTIAL